MRKCGVWSHGPKHDSAILETSSCFFLVISKDYEKGNRNTYCYFVIFEFQGFYRYAPKIYNIFVLAQERGYVAEISLNKTLRNSKLRGFEILKFSLFPSMLFFP